MSLCCIGGVCIPYSVLWPIVIIAFKSIYEFFFGKKIDKTNKEMEKLCCTGKSSSNENVQKSTNGEVIDIITENEYYSYIQSCNTTIVKHSASWCKPCQKIKPFYHNLATEHSSFNFITVDVDRFEQISAENGAVQIPYFVAFQNGQKVKSIGSSAEDQISNFVLGLKAKTIVSDS